MCQCQQIYLLTTFWSHCFRSFEATAVVIVVYSFNVTVKDTVVVLVFFVVVKNLGNECEPYT